MNSIDWSKEQRQAPIGLILFATSALRKIIKGMWPILLLYVFKDKKEDNIQYYFYIVLASVAFLVINSLLSYWYFRYSIIGNEFVVKKGYLKKIKLAVDIDRIQSVNISQNIVQQILGLVTVEIDTAGAKDAEIKLIAIKKEYANEFETKFAALKSDKSVEFTEISSERNDERIEKTKPKTKLLIKISFADLLKVGITENHFKNLLIVFGLVYGLYSQIGKDFQDIVDEYAAQGIENVENFSIMAFVNLGVTIFIFAVLVSIILNVIGYFDLKMEKEKNHFIISFGLITNKKINIPINKIQLLVWEYNPFKKLLGFKALKIRQASSGAGVKKNQKIEVPACSNNEQSQLENLIFNSKAEFSQIVKTNSFYFIRSFIIYSSIIAIAFTSFVMLRPEFLNLGIGIAAFIETMLAVLLFVAYKRRAYRISDDLLEITKGQIATTVVLLQTYKIQSVAYNQSVFMRRRKLSSIIIYTAAGTTLSIPYIKEDFACQMFNYLLFKVEESNQSWM